MHFCGLLNFVIICLFFYSDKYRDILPLSVSDLNMLENIQEVTDFVQVQANYPQFKTLSFLKNLKIIQGRNLARSVQLSKSLFRIFQ